MDARPSFGEKLTAAVANGVTQQDEPKCLLDTLGKTSIVNIISSGGRGEELRCEHRVDENDVEYLVFGRGSLKSGYTWEEAFELNAESTKKEMGERSRVYGGIYRQYFGS